MRGDPGVSFMCGWRQTTGFSRIIKSSELNIWYVTRKTKKRRVPEIPVATIYSSLAAVKNKIVFDKEDDQDTYIVLAREPAWSPSLQYRL